MEHALSTLETGIDRLQKGFEGLRDDDGFAELLRIIHRPGWTTPAELELVTGLVEIMDSHVKALTRMRELLIRGSREVGAHSAAR